jgi:hypothetical protein
MFCLLRTSLPRLRGGAAVVAARRALASCSIRFFWARLAAHGQ